MKKYSAIFHPDAETDMISAYRWGCSAWGEAAARDWVKDLQRVIKERLTALPMSCPLAPESDALEVDVRQLIVRRYRILFVVEKKVGHDSLY